MRLKNAPGAKNFRRSNAVESLEKRLKPGAVNQQGEPYTEEQIEKMEKELSILKSRIVSSEVAYMTKNKKYRGPR